MLFLIEDYNPNMGYHKCKPIDCREELARRNMSDRHIFLDLMVDGEFTDVLPESLVGKTISCTDLQPFISIACGVVIEQIA